VALVRRLRTAALGVIALVCAAAVASGAPQLKVIASDLSNPRKIFVAPTGAVYVVEAGTGGNTGSDRCVQSCVGETGAVVRIAGGKETRVVTGLGSFSVPGGQEAQGPAAVIAGRDGTFDVLMQDMQLDAHGNNKVGLPHAGELLSTSEGKVAARTIAKLAQYEATHNPDHGAGPGARYAQPPIDSDPYAFVAYRGGYAVVDSAANDLLWVKRDGMISVLAVFPTQPVTLTAKERRFLRAGSPKVLPVQSVPSSVTTGPDGALYVGELTGWPYRIGSARVWRVPPRGKPSVYARGFTNITDVAFHGRDLLVLELATRGLFDPTSPGALIRVTPRGNHSVVLSQGLSSPTGLAVGNGQIYISNHGTATAGGPEPHGQLVSIPAASA
jgi:hypothetical protein